MFIEAESCKYNVEIIEDKVVQNICGKRKIIIKYKSDDDVFLEIVGYAESRRPEFLIYKKEKEFEIDLSVKEKGTTAFFIRINSAYISPVYFKCDEEPTEKIYYPIHYTDYYYSDPELISPKYDHLTKGQKYTFEIKSNDFDQLYIENDGDYILMTKKGNIFKEENVYLFGDHVSIYNRKTRDKILLYYHCIGEDIDYPKNEDYYDNYSWKNKYFVKLLEPLSNKLIKGNQYKFELRCDTDDIKNFYIYYGSQYIYMDKINNIYSKTITINPDTTSDTLYIRCISTTSSVYNMYKYIIN